MHLAGKLAAILDDVEDTAAYLGVRICVEPLSVDCSEEDDDVDAELVTGDMTNGRLEMQPLGVCCTEIVGTDWTAVNP